MLQQNSWHARCDCKINKLLTISHAIYWCIPCSVIVQLCKRSLYPQEICSRCLLRLKRYNRINDDKGQNRKVWKPLPVDWNSARSKSWKIFFKYYSFSITIKNSTNINSAWQVFHSAKPLIDGHLGQNNRSLWMFSKVNKSRY